MAKVVRVVPPKPAPAGLTITQLAAKTGMSPRAIRFYVEEGLIPAAARGRSARYGRSYVTRLLAIRKLQRDEHLRLDRIKRRLAKLTPVEIEALAAAMSPKPATPAAAAAPKTAPSGPAAAVVTPAPMIAMAAFDAKSAAEKSWRRVEVLPGLEIHVRSDASAHVRRVMAEIEATFRVG